MVKNNNQWIAVVAVIALVLAIASFVVVIQSNVTGNVIKTSNTPSTSVPVNANLCNADGVCEMQSSINNFTKGNVIISSYASGYPQLVINQSGGSQTTITATGISFNGGYYVRTDARFGMISLTRLQEMNPVNATSDWFLCVGPQGDVYKKKTSCA